MLNSGRRHFARQNPGYIRRGKSWLTWLACLCLPHAKYIRVVTARDTMKSYADLYLESPRAFLTRLENDIKRIEERLSRLDSLAVEGVQNLLVEYERLAVLTEEGAYGVEQVPEFRWAPGAGSAAIPNIYPPELAGDGRWFAWTGPLPATEFRVALLRRRPLLLTVNLLRAFDEKMLSDLTISVDGERVQHEMPDPRRIVAVLPARKRASAKATTITIDSGFTVRPSNADARDLGIALVSFTVEPAMTNTIIDGDRANG